MTRIRTVEVRIRRASDVREYRTFELESGHIKRFTVQLMLRVKGKWLPVIRWDNSHKFVDCDRYDLKGQKKKLILNVSPEEGLTMAQNELNLNWRIYRERFLQGEMP